MDVPLDEIRKSATISALFEKHKDAFGASCAGRLKYEKKPGKAKGCLLVLTALNAYVLKSDSHTMIVMFPVDGCRPSVSGEVLTLHGGAAPFRLHGPRTVLYEATTKIVELARRLAASSAPAAAASTSSTSTSPPHTLSAAAAATSNSVFATTPADAPLLDASVSMTMRSGRSAHQASGGSDPVEAALASAVAASAAQPPVVADRRFLISSISASEGGDYSAVRSVYSLGEKEGAAGATAAEARRLAAQMKAHVAEERAELEEVAGVAARRFMASVEGSAALRPDATAGVRAALEEAAERVGRSAGDLYAAGADVYSARLEDAHLSAALETVVSCRAAAAAHRRAEEHVQEGKWYPALLAARELEALARPLAAHRYGRWVASEAVPGLRARISSAVQRDFNAWLTTARTLAAPFGGRALRWACERLSGQAEHAERQRGVVLVEDEEYGGGGAAAAAVAAAAPGTGAAAGSGDWADELLWDITPLDATPLDAAAAGVATSPGRGGGGGGGTDDDGGCGGGHHPLGAAQFLETLSDAMATSEGEVEGAGAASAGRRQTLRVVHTAQRVHGLLDPAGGVAALKRYYSETREKQLRLLLRQRPGVGRGGGGGGAAWLASVTGFFLVDLVVAQSTHPPLVHDYHVQGLWDDTVVCLHGWLEGYAAPDGGRTWEELVEMKERAWEAATALEDLWAVGGDSAHRLAPLHEAVGLLRRAALQGLREATLGRLQVVLAEESYLLLSKQDGEAAGRELFLRLSAAAARCCETVPAVAREILAAQAAGFRIVRGGAAGGASADDDVRALVDACLRHVAGQLDERAGRLGKLHTLQILMGSANAAALDAAALAAAQAHAERAAVSPARDGRLRVFAGARRVLREVGARLEQRGAALLREQAKACLDNLGPSMWLGGAGGGGGGGAPLAEASLDQYLVSKWTQRERHLPPATAARMKAIEVAEVDACLVSIATAIAAAEGGGGSRRGALEQLRTDVVRDLSQASAQHGATFSSFEAKCPALLAQADRRDRQDGDGDAAAAATAAATAQQQSAAEAAAMASHATVARGRGDEASRASSSSSPQQQNRKEGGIFSRFRSRSRGVEGAR